MSLKYISPNKLKNTNQRNISLTEGDDWNSKLFIEIQFEKDTHSFFFSRYFKESVKKFPLGMHRNCVNETFKKVALKYQPFGAWCPLKGRTYLINLQLSASMYDLFVETWVKIINTSNFVIFGLSLNFF